MIHKVGIYQGRYVEVELLLVVVVVCVRGWGGSRGWEGMSQGAVLFPDIMVCGAASMLFVAVAGGAVDDWYRYLAATHCHLHFTFYTIDVV